MVNLQSSFEGDLVDVYEGFFLDVSVVKKNIDWICSSFDQCNNGAERGRLLDIGCGTGIYEEFFIKNFQYVMGIDKSRDMIEYAKKNHSLNDKRVDFCVGDITTEVPDESPYDIVVMLAHVVGYMQTNKEINGAFSNISSLMKTGGILVFNFYNQPALFLNRLSPRTQRKVLEDGKEVTRISNATIDASNNCLDLDYYYIINRNIKGMEDQNIYEIHEKMRYYSWLEIENLLSYNGLEIIDILDYESKTDLDYNKDWNAVVIARKR